MRFLGRNRQKKNNGRNKHNGINHFGGLFFSDPGLAVKAEDSVASGVLEDGSLRE
jgi:hypothetical protein